MVANMCCSFVPIGTGESERTPCCARVGATVEEESAKPPRLQRQPTRSFTIAAIGTRRVASHADILHATPSVLLSRRAAFVFPLVDRLGFSRDRIRLQAGDFTRLLAVATEWLQLSDTSRTAILREHLEHVIVTAGPGSSGEIPAWSRGAARPLSRDADRVRRSSGDL